MNDNRPLGRRKTIAMLVWLTLLAWATQTLLHEWGFGQVAPPPDASPAPEKFVPGDGQGVPRGTLEVRGDAVVLGAEVKLKQVCRWSDADAAVFSNLGDLTIARLTESVPYKTISVDEIRQTLHDAGVNIAMVNFSGVTLCTVSRGDVPVDEHMALQKWIDAHQEPAAPPAPLQADANAAPAPVEAPVTPAVRSVRPAAPADAKPPMALRDLLMADLSQRVGLPVEALMVWFDPADEPVLNLSEPTFKFDLEAQRVRNLGAVSWTVTVISGTGSKKVAINARARAWQTQVVLARPVAFRQVLVAEDLMEKRTLIETLPEDTLLKKEQVVGWQAARDLKPGAVMTARLVDPVELVKTGQLVTVVVTQGTVQIKAVGRALEAGVLGQCIKVKNETTNDVFEATITGPQTARLGGPAGPAVAATN